MTCKAPSAPDHPRTPVADTGLATVNPPKVLEPVGRQFGIPDRVLDVLVPEVVLQSPCVGTLGGRPEALDKPMETDG